MTLPSVDPLMLFRAKVALCREQLNELIGGFEPDDHARFPNRVRFLYQASMDALRCGARAGLMSLEPLDRACRELWERMECASSPLAPRVRSLLPRTIEMLEQAARGEELGSTPETLRAEFDAARSDAAWSEHLRRIEMPVRRGESDATDR